MYGEGIMKSVRQQLIAGYSANDEAHLPHHPINCSGKILTLNEDNSMEWDHSKVGGDSERTQLAINVAAAFIILEEAEYRFGTFPYLSRR